MSELLKDIIGKLKQLKILLPCSVFYVSCLFLYPNRCLLKWLEIRSVCPMCNKPILRLHTDAPQGAEGPMDPEEV